MLLQGIIYWVYLPQSLQCHALYLLRTPPVPCSPEAKVPQWKGRGQGVPQGARETMYPVPALSSPENAHRHVSRKDRTTQALATGEWPAPLGEYAACLMLARASASSAFSLVSFPFPFLLSGLSLVSYPPPTPVSPPPSPLFPHPFLLVYLFIPISSNRSSSSYPFLCSFFLFSAAFLRTCVDPPTPSPTQARAQDKLCRWQREMEFFSRLFPLDLSFRTDPRYIISYRRLL